MTANAITRLTLAAALLGMGGCSFDLDFGDDWGGDTTWEDDYYGEGYTALDVSEVALLGDVGTVELDGAPARVAEAGDYGYGATFDVRASGRGGVGMNRLDIDGVSIAEIEPGEYTSTGYYSSTAGDPNFSVTGCSGPRDDDWDYDIQAETVQVVVTELDAWTVRIDWTATFPETETYGRGDPTTVPSRESRGSVVVGR